MAGALLTGAVQEGLLCLLAFDPESGSIVRSLVPPRLFDHYYREVSLACSDYWSKYGTAPGDHLMDLITDICRDHKEDAKIYQRLLKSMTNSRSGLNKDYLLDKARGFVRRQRLRDGIVRAADLLQQDREDEAVEVIIASTEIMDDLFNPGIDLSDAKQVLEALANVREPFPTGIKELDDAYLGPARKELWLISAAKKKGKSWCLIQLGKQAAFVHHMNVVHITLELSEQIVTQRYLQSMFSMSRHAASEYSRMDFVKDELGRVKSLEKVSIGRRPSFEDETVERDIADRVTQILSRMSLMVKEFPDGFLTIQHLEAYLDFLEAKKKFIPDLLIVDYAAKMRVPLEEYRLGLGRLVGDLRGLAVKRNMAVATANQLNREGARAKTAKSTHIAEDWSIPGTIDVGIYYSQTDAEKGLGLARLTVNEARNEADGMTVLISQNYALGQFCLASARMDKRYWGMIPKRGPDEEDPDDDDAGSGWGVEDDR